MRPLKKCEVNSQRHAIVANSLLLQDLGVRKRTQAFKIMKIIRETDPEYWEKVETEGDVPEMDLTSALPSCSARACHSSTF